ncbi:MAG: Rpn family recombination-promoting nuclease/putative transposase [Desulfovibrio sp.]|jgi:hypothetical protein|nr:Rpn family recombination-promoting nuclease/putative transposase [Desulfovibrio sp.]
MAFLLCLPDEPKQDKNTFMVSVSEAPVPHDGSYKYLFSHADMVESLIRDFVPEEWVRDLDFSTLEKQNGSYVTDDLRVATKGAIAPTRRACGRWPERPYGHREQSVPLGRPRP